MILAYATGMLIAVKFVKMKGTATLFVLHSFCLQR
jgi:hypothetical protein